MTNKYERKNTPLQDLNVIVTSVLDEQAKAAVCCAANAIHVFIKKWCCCDTSYTHTHAYFHIRNSMNANLYRASLLFSLFSFDFYLFSLFFSLSAIHFLPFPASYVRDYNLCTELQ